jgi:REP element-mobilizing transposase RayT
MARKVRIQYPGAIYHVMNRGGRREAIFEDDEDRERLLQTLTQACQKTGWQVHAYCLMRNHLHRRFTATLKPPGGYPQALW